MLAANDQGQVPWTPQDLNGNFNNLQEREQGQRSIRFLMMFLLMLTLMDSEEAQRKRDTDSFNLRKRKTNRDSPMEQSLYLARRNQDAKLEQLLQSHPRYQHLITRNDGKDFDKEVRLWTEQQPELIKDEFTQGLDQVRAAELSLDSMAETKVFHYPWNASGFYRGEWYRNVSQSTVQQSMKTMSVDDKRDQRKLVVEPLQIEAQMAQLLQAKGESTGVILLPDGFQLKLPNTTTITNELSQKKSMSHQPTFLRGASAASIEDRMKSFQVTLTKTSGRVAFQLYSRTVPAIKELSIIDGFVKLYDSNTIGYSTRRDILLRVNGVALHSLGILSLVASPSQARSAFVILSQEQQNEHHRRLQEAVVKPAQDIELVQIRKDALSLYPPGELTHEGPRDPNYDASIVSMPAERTADTDIQTHRTLTQTTAEPALLQDNTTSSPNSSPESYSDMVFPYPFVLDDKWKSIGRTRTPAARSMPPREQLLEANAGSCEFEMTFNIKEEEWTIGQWRTLLARHAREAARHDSSARESLTINRPKEIMIKNSKKAKGSKTWRVPQDQALAMTLNGTVVSNNCGFQAEINVTAVRTDWENTTGKAINYSFYMMLTCLTQIVLLLRQLLHSQSQSAATRVSLLCIGWQTVLDALLCLVHIYLSLAMQPLFTAFASVAFFKLLIFCVIEMKYMAIIIQARNASNGGNTSDLLRRQIAMLHLRFYLALMASFIAVFYAWDSYRTMYMLVLYSFWVPQIVQNIVTEAKRPLHHYYVYGMSLTRLVAPLYVFGVQNNFLKEIYPDSQTNLSMCELLVLWVGIQTAILEAQGKYGARFMIPARFLPPKFDYSRPIPSSLLPPETEEETPSESLHKERAAPEMRASLISRDSSPHRATGARNRIKGNRTSTNETPMTSETISASLARPLPTFECCICYSEIDIRNTSGYMLAPCDHLFHRDCLVQWMEVKMECPICRKDLPAL